MKTFFQRGGEKKRHKDINGVEIFFTPRVTPTLRQPSQRQGTLEGFDLMRYSAVRRSNAPGPHYKAE